MSFVFGVHTMFDDSVTIADPTILAAAKAINLARNKGAFYQAMGAPAVAINTVDFEVYSRSKTARAGTVGAGGWDDSATADLPVDSTSIKGLTIGHVLDVAGEQVIVSAVDRSANTIDVYARGAGGTTAAAHLAAVAFKVVGFAGKDSTLKNVESVSESTSAYKNYLQTVFETLDWEFRGAQLRRQGLSDANIVTVLTQEASYRVAEMLASMAIVGKKQLGSKTGSPYMSAGLLAQLADNNSGNRPVLSYDASGALTETKLKAALADATKYGNPDTIWCSNKVKGTINGFNGSLTTTIDRTEHIAGQYINQYDYEGLILDVKVDADLPDTTVPIVTQAKCQKGWAAGDYLTKKEEPAQSSREFRESLQGSVGYIIEDVGYDHTYIYGIS